MRGTAVALALAGGLALAVAGAVRLAALRDADAVELPPEAWFSGPAKTLFVEGGASVVPWGMVARDDAAGHTVLIHLDGLHPDRAAAPAAPLEAPEPILAAGADPAAGMLRMPRIDPDGARAVSEALAAAATPSRLMSREGAVVGVAPLAVAAADILLEPVAGGCAFDHASGASLPDRRTVVAPYVEGIAWTAVGPNRAVGRSVGRHHLVERRRAGRLDLICALSARDPLPLAVVARHLRSMPLPETDTLPDEVVALLRAHPHVAPLGDGLYTVARARRDGIHVMRADGSFVSDEGWWLADWLPSAGAILVEPLSRRGVPTREDRGLLHPDGTMLVAAEYYDIGDVPGRPGVARLWKGGRTTLYSVAERRVLPPED